VSTPATPHDANGPPLRGGRYVLVRKLGEGSQGATYEAIDHGVGPEAQKRAARAAPLVDKWARYVREQKSGGAIPQEARLVAIKCFRVGTAKAWKDVELAEREARTLASLDHPHLPRYFEHFEEEGALYLVMEKIEGESLAALRKQGGKGKAMSVAEITRMLEDIGGALRYLHGLAPPVIHRDIKPGNIIRRPDGSFALVDFGAVRDRLRPAGGSTVVGTFGFMAPEQFQGRASAASDVYGLGATAITMLAGIDPEELPHEGLGIDVARAVPRGLPGSLVRALEAMLAADPDRRVATVDEALAILHGGPSRGDEEHDEDERAAPSAPSASPRLGRKQQRALAKRKEKEERALARREQKRLRRTASRRRRPPLLPRMLGRLGLFAAMLVVWVTVGFAVPVVLILLSLLFGASLRRAAAKCVDAARRSQASLGRASMWLSGRGDEPPARAPREEEAARVRVAGGSERVRAALEESVEAPAEGADAWMEERLEKEAQRERMRMHARAPANRDAPGRRRK
jgi:serine/threonine protein kinase